MTARRRSAKASAVVSVVAGGIFLAGMAVSGAPAETVRISVHSDGGQADGSSYGPAISANGGRVAFTSGAEDLVEDDPNPFDDVFVHDTATGTTALLSVHSDGTPADSFSHDADISADGRHVVFESSATTLVEDDTNGFSDVFVHDSDIGTTARVSVHSDGSESDNHSYGSDMSPDGRYVGFDSSATNLVDDDTNGDSDVFVHDTLTGATTRISLDEAGMEADNRSSHAALAANASHVAFYSYAANLVDDDTNGQPDVFVRDTQTHEVTRVSVHTDGTQSDGPSYAPVISADGRHVAFESYGTTLAGSGDNNGEPDIFIHDSHTGTTTRVSVHSDGSEGSSYSLAASISPDGRHVGFLSHAENLVDGDTNGQFDAFVHDTHTGTTTRISVRSNGDEGIDGGSTHPALSVDGGYIAFQSDAVNLIDDDTNAETDVFVRRYLPDSQPPTTSITSTSTTTPMTPNPPPGDVEPSACREHFDDDDGSVFETDINCMAESGITRGCNPPNNDRFCPQEPVTRGQMAAFLVRALGLAPSTPAGFTDTIGSVFAADIDSLAAAGITRGCNPPNNDRFCPQEPVTRGQMAAFLNRAFLAD